MPNFNKLKEESSPYLLQHANNPVHWQAWNSESLQEAKVQDKPILLSIGYAACHWCHVMEHESFEDEQVAKLMNENFICIKVDREERPDVDQIYMDAVQAMGLNGGWPLNVFLMPDQKPFYGGTYFPKNNWMELLDKVAVAFQRNKDKLAESAENFAQALNISSSEQLNFTLSNSFEFDKQVPFIAFQKLQKFLDMDNGGTLGAPKFPMPSIWEFIFNYYQLEKNDSALKAVEFTLQEMAKGGIYDQVGGGFSRYSVDNEWFAPHFEKMLYDNGQLISLYAKVCRETKDPFFKQIVSQSIEFVQRELSNGEGGIFSALDADSEGVEGKFYTWTLIEWKTALAEDSELIGKYYSVTDEGNWEEERNILYQNIDPESFAKLHKIKPEEFVNTLEQSKNILLKEREKRIRPATDDKVLAGWNALYLISLCDAYKLESKAEYFNWAEESYQFIKNKLIVDARLYRNYKNGKASIYAYLEDYALTIKAFLAYAEISSKEEVILEANTLCQYVMDHFYDPIDQMFFYTDDTAEALIARKKEVFDNVIPSSNAIMAHNLHWLGILLQKHDWTTLSNKMVHQLHEIMQKEPRYMSCWLSVYLLKAFDSYEIVISGPNAKQEQEKLWSLTASDQCYIINHKEGNDLPLFSGKTSIKGKDTFYVCQDTACKQAVFSAEEALADMKK